MDFLPPLPELGQLDLIEVYHFYDQPVFFACRNVENHIFMAVWVDEEQDFETWLYLPVSLNRFKEVRHGEIDLQSALTYAEDKEVFEVQLSDDHRFASLRKIPSQRFPKALRIPILTLYTCHSSEYGIWFVRREIPYSEE